MLRDLIAEHGLEDRVILAGPTEDVPGEMAQASIYALSLALRGVPARAHRGDEQGDGRASPSTARRARRDIIDDHRNGLLVPPPRDVEALSAALLEMVGDEELRRRCGAAAVETAARLHDGGDRAASGTRCCRSSCARRASASNRRKGCSQTPMRRFLPLLLIAIAAAAALPAAASAKTGRCLCASGPQCYVWTGKVTFVPTATRSTSTSTATGRGRRVHVRIGGLNAMEQTVYTSRASQRRGECHALEATSRLDQLLKAAKYKVRLEAQDPASRSGSRLRRSIWVKSGGRWIDVARVLLTEGHAMWLPNAREWAWNKDYSVLAEPRRPRPAQPLGPGLLRLRPQRGPAAAACWSTGTPTATTTSTPTASGCGSRNNDPVNPLPLGGWWLRDSALRRYTFPELGDDPARRRRSPSTTASATTTTASSTGACAGRRSRTSRTTRPQMGDGAYLFDPQGDLRYSMTYPCREGVRRAAARLASGST